MRARHRRRLGEVNTKTLHGLKVTSEGKVSAVIATLNTKDHDGDVTLAGAFGTQSVRLSTWNHGSWGEGLPIGKGTISEKGDEAIFSGRFFMGMQSARDTFEAIKGLEDLGQWSYGFHILDAERGMHDGVSVQFLKRLQVTEVSPVILGAGLNTRTLAMKSRDADQLEPWQRRALRLRTEKCLKRAEEAMIDARRAEIYERAVHQISYPQRKAAADLEANLQAYERLDRAEVLLRRLSE